MGAGLARRRTPTPPPSSGFRHKRPPTAGCAVPPFSFSSHIYLYIHTYTYIKGFIPHPLGPSPPSHSYVAPMWRLIPSKPIQTIPSSLTTILPSILLCKKNVKTKSKNVVNRR
ncbi:hypothetical protein Hanom_Chr09g00833771 [Helianthus anomalus]